MVQSAKELKVYKEDFGIPFDASKALVIVDLLGPGDEIFSGISVDLDGTYGSSWIITGNDELGSGNTVLEDSLESVVIFTDVVPGSIGMTLNTPDGVLCSDRKLITVLAGHYVRVVVSCEMTGG